LPLTEPCGFHIVGRSALRPASAAAALIIARAARASLSADEARDARREIETTRQSIEQIDAMLMLRRQDLRPM
jgi:hypothetical protein